MAVAAARLGASTAFIGKVGRDGFGGYLTGVLKENGVDTSGVRTDAAPTTMAVVTVAASGERSFRFVRGRTAPSPRRRWTPGWWRGPRSSTSAP